EYMFVTTLLKIEQHLLAQGRCPYKLFRPRSITPATRSSLGLRQLTVFSLGMKRQDIGAIS
ncbi:hypothetical protein, partial [Pseudaeromonas pectinilytica]